MFLNGSTNLLKNSLFQGEAFLERSAESMDFTI
jgi:hypothetical protein